MDIEKDKKVLNTINTIQSSILFYQNKIKTSKTISLVSYIASIVFFVLFIISISLFFTIIHNKILMIFLLISLVIGFIFLQLGLVFTLVGKYLYKPRLESLLNATNLIKKEINKDN